VKDAHRFFVHSKDVIAKHPLQTYASALLFSPSGSLIRTAFQHEEPNWITIQPHISETWRSCLHTFENLCDAVAFSHNSNLLALAISFPSGTIRIWNADSSTFILEFQGPHADPDTYQIRFFDESAKLVIISGEIIESWDVATGTCLSTRRHERWMFLQKVPFCNDVALHASANATGEGSFKIFDTDEARDLSFLTSPHHDSKGVFNSTFSPSGRFLAVNFVTNIKVWDATSSGNMRSLELPMCNEDSKITLVKSAWVSDSALLAVGLSDGTMIVFSISNGDVLHILQSGAETTLHRASVAISYDSRKLASPSGRLVNNQANQSEHPRLN
jgi:WD40 repeat protein